MPGFDYNNVYHYGDFTKEFTTVEWDSNSLKEMVLKMKRVLAYIQLGGNSVFLVKLKGDKKKGNKFTTSVQKYSSTLAEAKQNCATVVCWNESKKDYEERTVTLKDFITDAKNSITYNLLVFSPYITMDKQAGDEDDFNTFTGYAAHPLRDDEEVDEEVVSCFLGHIHKVWCNSDGVVLKYLLDLLAFTVQNPCVKPGIAPVLIGTQGCGKTDVLLKLGERLFGQQYTTIVNCIESLTGKFNKQLENKKLIIADEVKGFGKDSDRLKNQITCVRQTVEMKGVDPYEVDDHCLMVFCSNNIDYFKVELGDRRYLILQCSGEHVRDKAYFDALFGEMESPLFGDHLYTYLLRRDISGFSRIQDLPMTEIKQSLQSATEEPCLAFIKEVTVKEVCKLAENLMLSGGVQWQNLSSIRNSIDGGNFDGFVRSTHWYILFNEWYKGNYKGSVPKLSQKLFSMKIAYHAHKEVRRSNIAWYKPYTWDKIKSWKEETGLKRDIFNSRIVIEANSDDY